MQDKVADKLRSEVDKLYQKMMSKTDELNRGNILTKLVELPLTHPPGTAWNDGVSPTSLALFSKDSQGEGYGLAMSVTVDPGLSGFMSSKGNFGWGGAASTYFRVDPKEKIIILISMAQFILMGFHRYHDDFRNLVYQALVD